MTVYQDFLMRVSKVPFHGLGLSVDVYSPDLFELIERLEQHGLSCDYLEVFKATQWSMKAIRSRLPEVSLEYHADGLWVTQPDWRTAYPVEEELHIAATHLHELRCHWLNQECASKQMAGYSFGTYLPPLLTSSSAEITAANAQATQIRLDALMKDSVDSLPLLLLETPPLTYFAFGNLSYAKFFRMVTDTCSCGVVLDIGHIWTVYRYSKAWNQHSLNSFLKAFLQDFPLERVVQIHVAGLHRHPAVPSEKKHEVSYSQDWPDWVDAHGAPIPEELWGMLGQVLRCSRLINLKGIALEVDTKPIELIVEEFACFRERWDWWKERGPLPSLIRDPENQAPAEQSRFDPLHPSPSFNSILGQYTQYVGVVTGHADGAVQGVGELNEEEIRNIRKYSLGYLPYEILEWGGDVREMFPQTVQGLHKQGIDLSHFVRYWYSSPRPVQERYDFFLLKLKYFVEFVQKTLPHLSEVASREAVALRRDYAMASGLG